MTSSLRQNPIVRALALLGLAFGFFAVAPVTAGAADVVACVDSPDWAQSAESGQDGWKYGETMVLAVDPAEAHPGDTVTISGSGYPRNCTFEVFVAGVSVGVATTDDDGNFSIEWTVPEDAEPGVLDITTDLDGITKHATLTIVAADEGTPGDTTPGTTTPGAATPGGAAPGAGAPPAAGGAGILPKTGSQILPFLGVGIGLLVLGSMLVLANRKRATAH